MADLPSDSPAFEIQPRLNEEMEYFKEMALQETERWIECVTNKRFKYPENPRRSLQDGILLCELVNALKPGCIRKINRLPAPIAFLDNLTVFQNVCRHEFGLQEAQLFDIKDLEDLSLRGVLESEEEIQHETSRRLKNVVITIFWLGKAVRRWYKGPMLDFSVFTDIIDMSHSSQASFRTPSEASFGRFSMDQFSSPRPGPRQSDLAYERVAKYLESKPYDYPGNNDYPESLSGAERGDGSSRTSGYDDETFESRSWHNKERAETSPKPPPVALRRSTASDVRKYDSAFQDHSNGLVDKNLKNKESRGQLAERVSSPEKTPQSAAGSRKDGLQSPVNLSRKDGLQSPVRVAGPQSPVSPSRVVGTQSPVSPSRVVGTQSPASPSRVVGTQSPVSPSQKHASPSPVSPSRKDVPHLPVSSHGSGTLHNPLQFVKGDSSSLAENAKQVMKLTQQQQSTRHSTTIEEDLDWEAKLTDWKSRRRSQTKSQSASEGDEVKDDQSSATETAASGQPSPSRTVIKKKEQEEDMLAVFGFTKMLNNKPVAKPRISVEGGGDGKTQERHFLETSSQWQEQEKEAEKKLLPPEWSSASSKGWSFPSRKQEVLVANVLPDPGFALSNCDADVNAKSSPNKRFLEKIIKISQRPQHDKGFGFTIKGGKEFGLPITVEKVHLGGAADVCNLKPKDEIVAINGALLANHYLESVKAVIDQAVHSGQVEMTIRRILSDTTSEETSEDVFSEEDLDFSEDQTDETEGELAHVCDLETGRPLTPLPPEDEPPPLPSAPPPPPNWSTFPGSETAFAPGDDSIRYFDDEALQSDITVSRPVRPVPPCGEFIQEEGRLPDGAPVAVWKALPEKHLSETSSDKYDLLMKRINFFGLKPEDSEEYKRIIEGDKTTRQVKGELPEKVGTSRSTSSSADVSDKIPSASQSEERVFALVVKPSGTEKTPGSQFSSPPSSAVSYAPFAAMSSPQRPSLSSSNSVAAHSDRRDQVREQQEIGKSVYGIESRTPDSCHSQVLDDKELKSEDRKWLSSNENSQESTEISPKAESPAFVGKDSAQTMEVKLREKPVTEVPSSRTQCQSEDFSQTFQNSKGWKSMELIRSYSTSSAVRVDPTERAREDYLSLMMTQPKPNLDAINRQYFDLDSDLRRMEEWNKKQEQLRKEKFDQDQENLRMKHEMDLQQATVVEKVKQKQEEQMLEKDIIWKQQLEEIQVEREKELAKREKEERLRQKMAAENAEREKQKLAAENAVKERQKLAAENEERERQKLAAEKERQKLAAENAEKERELNEMMRSFDQHPNHVEDSRGTTASQLTSEEYPKSTASYVHTGKVESSFIDTAPAYANLELLSDSVHASSESLSSSTQTDCWPGDVGNGSKNMETIVESGTTTSPGILPQNFVARDSLYDTRPVQDQWKTERSSGGASLFHTAANSKPGFKETVHGGTGPSSNKDLSALKEETNRSAQLVREEALLISRRAGGSSQWGSSQWSGSDQDTESLKPPPPVRRNVSPNLTSDFQQQPQNRAVLQDYSALPRHRLIDSESWIVARSAEDEDPGTGPSVIAISRRDHGAELHVGPSGQSWSHRPTVPTRNDSLKQMTPAQIPSTKFDPKSGQSLAPPIVNTRSISPPSSETVSSPNSVYNELYSYRSQLQGSLEQLEKYPTNAAEQFQFRRNREIGEVPEPSTAQIPLRSSSYNVVQQIARTRPFSSDYSLDPSRFGGFASPPPNQPAVPYRRDLRDPIPPEPTSEAIGMLFNYHEHPLQDNSRGNTGRDFLQSPGQTASPKNDPIPPEPTSEAISMLFNYHEHPLQDNNRRNTGRDLLQSPGQNASPSLSSDGGQKCSGCDKDLEGLKYSKV